MWGKRNILRKLWSILHFKHLIMCREVTTKHVEWFWNKSNHILKPWIFRKISGKWHITRKLWNILHLTHLIMCREVTTKHFEWFWNKSNHTFGSLGFFGKYMVTRTIPENYGKFCTLHTSLCVGKCLQKIWSGFGTNQIKFWNLRLMEHSQKIVEHFAL
jgi:hypothetical protein